MENSAKTKFIYLDNAAATPVAPQVFAAMSPFLTDQFFNPSAPYLPAKRVREAYEDAKNRLAHTIGAKGSDLIITAGATESINLAFTVLLNFDQPEALILTTEHPSVRNASKALAERAGGKVEEINVDRTGYIDLKDLKSKITDRTVLISASLANNELGTIQPLSEISGIIKTVVEDRLARGISTPLYLHSDASQALSLVDISVARLGIDLLTLNSAKVYGPKGIGALYAAHGPRLHPIVYGGGQEMGLRSGTENVPGVVGFAKAAELAKDHLASNRKHYEDLNKIFRAILKNGTDDIKPLVEPAFLGNPKHQLANFAPVSFAGIDAERLIYILEDQGILVSTGAACAASKGERSHVLTAAGLTDEEIAGSIRITFGAMNTEDDVKTAAIEIIKAVNLEFERTHRG